METRSNPTALVASAAPHPVVLFVGSGTSGRRMLRVRVAEARVRLPLLAGA
jgi:hypothetical protein